MSSSKKNKLLNAILRANIAGCGCGRPKLSDVYEPTAKLKVQISKTVNPQRHSSSSSCDKNDMSFTVDEDNDDDEDQCTSTTMSFNNNSCSSRPSVSAESTNPKNTKISSPAATWTKIDDSIAVVKESNDPYDDFRQSMMQMIVEKQIYSKQELQELLNCFLELNSPSHHDVIIQAFTQIWNDQINEKEETNNVTRVMMAM